MSLAVWLGVVRKCSAAVVGLLYYGTPDPGTLKDLRHDIVSHFLRRAKLPST